MFHIYGKISIFPSLALCPEVEHIYIGNKKGFEVEEKLVNNLIDRIGLCRLNAESLEEIVGKEKTFSTMEDFFSYLIGMEHFNNDFPVYCDSTNYCKLFCTFIKTLLPKITEKMAYTLYRLGIYKSIVYFSKTGEYIYLLGSHFPIASLIEKVEIFSFSAFKEVFKNSIALRTHIRQPLLKKASLEYYISSLLAGDDSYKSLLSTKLKNIIYRNLVAFTNDIAADIICRCYDLKYHIKGVTTSYEESPQQIVDKIDVLKDLFSYSKSDKFINREQIEKIKKLQPFVLQCYNKCNVNEGTLLYDGEKFDCRYSKYLELIDMDPLDILKEDMKYGKLNFSELLIPRWCQGTKINNMILSFIYSLYENKDPRLNQLRL